MLLLLLIYYYTRIFKYIIKLFSKSFFLLLFCKNCKKTIYIIKITILKYYHTFNKLNHFSKYVKEKDKI